MYLFPKGTSLLLLLAVVLSLEAKKQATQAVNQEELKKTSDSPIFHVIKKAKEISKDSIKEADQALIYRFLDKDVFMFCIGHSKDKKFYLMNISMKNEEPVLHLLFRVDSCAEDMEQKVALAVDIIHFDFDMVTMTFLARVKNEGCYRYTSTDHKLMSCNCPDIDTDHSWVRLQPQEARDILQKVSNKAKDCPMEPEEEDDDSNDDVVQEKNLATPKKSSRKKRNAAFGIPGMSFAVELNRFT